MPSGEESLQALLDDARSVYTLKDNGSGLERRVGLMAVKALDAAVNSAEANPESGSAAGHLRAAWGAARAFRPDPEKAYSQAIKAVEAAAHAVVEPYNNRATLGTMIRYVRDHATEFVMSSTAADSVLTVAAMMNMLWKGQTARHGGKAPTRPETLEEAQVAVQLAVTLVEWFASGAIYRF